jgi:hypothetical protein
VALGIFVAGPYTSTFNSVLTGQTKQGYRLTVESLWQNIDESDAHGRTLQDGIFVGSNAYCMYSGLEADSSRGSMGAFWPWGNSTSAGTLGAFETTSIPPGTLASSMAKPLILSGVANTPASASQPFAASMTAANAMLAPSYPAELLLGTALREVPIKLQLLPYVVSSTTKHFSYS